MNFGFEVGAGLVADPAAPGAYDGVRWCKGTKRDPGSVGEGPWRHQRTTALDSVDARDRKDRETWSEELHYDGSILT